VYSCMFLCTSCLCAYAPRDVFNACVLYACTADESSDEEDHSPSADHLWRKSGSEMVASIEGPPVFLEDLPTKEAEGKKSTTETQSGDEKDEEKHGSTDAKDDTDVFDDTSVAACAEEPSTPHTYTHNALLSVHVRSESDSSIGTPQFSRLSSMNAAASARTSPFIMTSTVPEDVKVAVVPSKQVLFETTTALPPSATDPLPPVSLSKPAAERESSGDEKKKQSHTLADSLADQTLADQGKEDEDEGGGGVNDANGDEGSGSAKEEEDAILKAQEEDRLLALEMQVLHQQSQSVESVAASAHPDPHTRSVHAEDKKTDEGKPADAFEGTPLEQEDTPEDQDTPEDPSIDTKVADEGVSPVVSTPESPLHTHREQKLDPDAFHTSSDDDEETPHTRSDDDDEDENEEEKEKFDTVELLPATEFRPKLKSDVQRYLETRRATMDFSGARMCVCVCVCVCACACVCVHVRVCTFHTCERISIFRFNISSYMQLHLLLTPTYTHTHTHTHTHTGQQFAYLSSDEETSNTGKRDPTQKPSLRKKLPRQARNTITLSSSSHRGLKGVCV
jgi:hypothetical protein